LSDEGGGNRPIELRIVSLDSTRIESARREIVGFVADQVDDIRRSSVNMSARSKIVIGLLTLVVGAATVAAQSMDGKAAAPSLKAGDKAPALTVEKWVKGSEVKQFEKTRSALLFDD
jgi:hypothetical protein